MRMRNRLMLICGALIWAIIPLVSPSPTTLNLFVFWFLNCIQAIGLSLLFGYAGQISMGQAAFYGIGAYVAAFLTTKINVPPFIGIVIGALFSGAVGYALGRPILRLRGYYLAMATDAFGLIVSTIFSQWSSITGGYSGIQGIPGISLVGISLTGTASYYYFIGVITIMVMYGVWRLVKSPHGRAMRSIRESEAAARSVGVEVAELKSKVFAVAAGLSGLAGGLYACYMSYVSPDSFTFDSSITLLLAVVLGGYISVWGAVLGSGLLTFLPQWLQGLQDAYGLIFGLAVIVILVLSPNGIYGLWLELLERISSRRKGIGSGSEYNCP